MEAMLTDSRLGPSALIVDGWLALACAGSWSFLVFGASYLMAGFYTGLRAYFALLDLRLKQLREKIET